jgi:hypothetical protein
MGRPWHWLRSRSWQYCGGWLRHLLSWWWSWGPLCWLLQERLLNLHRRLPNLLRLVLYLNWLLLGSLWW